MAVESAEFVNDLVVTNPPSSDSMAEGDDHIRLIKDALKNTFPDAEKPFYFPKSRILSSGETLGPEDSGTLLTINANSGNLSITLPDDMDNEQAGWVVYLTRNDDSANEVTIVGDISGISSPKLIGERIPVSIMWSGSAFYFVGEPNVDAITEMVAANSVAVGRAPTKVVRITGNTNINSFGKGMAGQRRFLIFTGTPRVNHDVNSLVCLGGVNLQMAANSRMEVMCIGGEWWIVLYARTNQGAEI